MRRVLFLRLTVLDERLHKLDEKLHRFASGYIRPDEAKTLIKIMNDQIIEYPFVIKHLKGKMGKILDVGSSPIINELHGVLLALGFEVHGVDRQPSRYSFEGFPKYHYHQGDIKQGLSFSDNYFDYVTCISTLEHIGRGGRYGENEDKNGDKKAVREMVRVLRPDGELIITVPFGRYYDGSVYARIYDRERLFGLFEGLEVEDVEFYKTNEDGVFVKTSEKDVENFEFVVPGAYPLILVLLKKPAES